MSKVTHPVQDKSIGLFQKIIFWFLLPILFTIFLAIVILSIAGIDIWGNIKEIGKNTPVISNVFQEEEEPPNIAEFEEKIVDLEFEIQQRYTEIDRLETQLANKDRELENLKIEKQSLQHTIEELIQMKDEQKRAFNEIIYTYESMNPKNAAAIINEMNDGEALKVLSNVQPESLAKILEKLPVQDAAKYSEMLSANTSAN